MPFNSGLRSTFLAAALAAATTPSVAEEYIYLNGKPCGAFCRAWMGVELPADHMNSADRDNREADGESAGSARSIRAVDAPRAVHSGPKRILRAPRWHVNVAVPPPRGPSSESIDRQAINGSSRVAESGASGPGSSAPAPISTGSITPAPTPDSPGKDVSKSLEAFKINTPAPMPTGPSNATPVAAALDAAVVRSGNVTGSRTMAPQGSEEDRASPRHEPSDQISNIDIGPIHSPNPESGVSARGKAADPSGVEADAASSPAAAASSVGASDGSGGATSTRRVAAGDRNNGQLVASTRGADILQPRAALAATRATPAVLIVLAAPSVAGAADLNNKPVVIAGLSTISRADLSAALAAAGANAVELREGSESDIDQLIGGQVSAAIVAFLTPAKASQFPLIPGFTLLKIAVPDPRGS